MQAAARWCCCLERQVEHTTRSSWADGLKPCLALAAYNNTHDCYVAVMAGGCDGSDDMCSGLRHSSSPASICIVMCVANHTYMPLVAVSFVGFDE